MTGAKPYTVDDWAGVEARLLCEDPECDDALGARAITV